MLGVLQGFALILGIIGAGYLAALFRVVEGEQRRVLNNVAFFVATPALLFSVLRQSDPSVILWPAPLWAPPARGTSTRTISVCPWRSTSSAMPPMWPRCCSCSW
jgi:predicted permease